MDLASIYFGLFLGIFVFALGKAVEQTRHIWSHTHRLTHPYLYMIWAETWVNFVFCIVTFLFLNKIIPGSLGFYLATVALWSIQTQLLPQIIANRVSLIMVHKRRARQLKWSLVILIGCVNIAVSYIWTTAQLPTASPYQVMLNHMFEKAEKSFFLVIDLALNLYFLYLVRFRLIADGLTKYWRLFNFNVGMVGISTSMDILLLGFLSLPDPYLYVQFAPVAYIVKLYIEILMANLITKVVRSGAAGRSDGFYKSSSHKSHPTNLVTSRVVISGNPQAQQPGNTLWSRIAKDAPPPREGSNGSEIHLNPYPDNGITKTVETTIVVDDAEPNREERTEV